MEIQSLYFANSKKSSTFALDFESEIMDCGVEQW